MATDLTCIPSESTRIVIAVQVRVPSASDAIQSALLAAGSKKDDTLLHFDACVEKGFHFIKAPKA